ncbi:hypothetical protein GUITHDRAFT_107211 [Guillardia theta CCMP2712]|uniref:Sulfotransferase domain-containing protein n=1 Tax=Guillardia theta (strain CCMP2712) TaxID=905079 RepID=L1JEZ2_GUITC|nr:hypothetical protein GUITHDRAFT_107211 [Guillardia theta CCMP2712]EKX46857.1 hypothetical protein GUITHDRAFT_107211 [Guillardia theta CCMP2712]|eukprot:XP_005833837.1 hypothetical protein GUITHDRAFT_107211 [Guillardia theta CCMP2712]
MAKQNPHITTTSSQGFVSKNDVFRNRANSRFSRCRQVLVNSQGGVGSSAFMELLQKNHVLMNSPEDVDGFKHRPADHFRHDSDGIYLFGRFACASKALVILGDPLHSIESVYRRFSVDHINKWREYAQKPPYHRRTRLADLWAEMRILRQDTTGLTNYINSWLRAKNEPTWPQLRLVTTKSLYEHAADHAKFLGVREENLLPFKQLAYNPRPFRSSAPADVQAMFGPIKVKIDQLEASSDS